MPLVERRWSSPDPLDPLTLLDGVVEELLGSSPPSPVGFTAGGLLLPIAGGAPGLLDEFSDAWGWASGSVANPIAAALGVGISSLAQAAMAAVAGLFSVTGWWIYRWLDDLWKPPGTDAIPPPPEAVAWRSLFPHPDVVKGLAPWWYMTRWPMMLWQGIGRWINDTADWLWAQVLGGLNFLINVVRESVDWLWVQVLGGLDFLIAVVRDTTAWLWAQVLGGLNFVLAVVRDTTAWLWAQVLGGLDFLIGVVRDTTAWLWAQVLGGLDFLINVVRESADWLWAQVLGGFTAVTDALWEGLKWLYDNVISKIPEGIVAGAQEIGRLIREAFEWFVNEAFGPVLEVVNAKLAIPGKLARMEYSSLEELLNDVLDPPETMIKGPFAIAFVPGVLIGIITMFLATAIGPFSEPVAQEYRKLVGARIPPFAMLRAGFLRDLLPESVHDDWLGRSGFEPANITLQKALYEEIPGPTDLVRMGVREVFTPEIAERFGQFEDFPPAFGEWMAKQGFTDFWAKAFWGAHWDLPSVTQGFEMFHRGVIDDADLDLLLRALDVMPFWRDNLKEIAFRVITRVDVRRMYAEGVFERDQVKRVYLDLGYKPEDAEALTEFVVRRYPRKGSETVDDLRSLTTSSIKQAYARRLITGDDVLERLMELDYSANDAALIRSTWEFDWLQDPSLRSDVDPKGLARSTIEKAYERRLIDLNAGVLELGELGYTPEDARLLLQLVDLRLDEQLADLEIDGLVSDYQDGIISDAQLAAALADLNIPQGRVDFLLQREILQRQARRRRLTLSQMKKALAADLMEEGEYRARLDAAGYNTRDVDILVALNVEAV